MKKLLRLLLRLVNFYEPVRYLHSNRVLLRNLIKRRFSQNYRSSVMGNLWSIIHPLFMLLIYSYVFREVFKVRWGTEADESNSMFAVTMFTGMVFFNIFAEALNASANVMAGNVNFVKKTIFPLELLPVTQSFGAAITGIICFILIFCGNIVLNGMAAFSWSVLLFPVIFILFLLFISGFCLFAASLGVYFRDTQFICGIILQVLFFITPIFYPVSAVPEKYRWVLDGNPFSLFVDVGRSTILNGVIPEGPVLWQIALMSIAVWQVGWTWFSVTKKGFADVL